MYVDGSSSAPWPPALTVSQSEGNCGIIGFHLLFFPSLLLCWLDTPPSVCKLLMVSFEKSATFLTCSWGGKTGLQTHEVGQMCSGSGPFQRGRERREPGPGMAQTWLGCLRRKTTGRRPELDSRASAEQDGTHRLPPLSSSVPLSRGQEILGRNKVQGQDSWCCPLIWKQGSPSGFYLTCNERFAEKDLRILTFLLSLAV